MQQMNFPCRPCMVISRRGDLCGALHDHSDHDVDQNTDVSNSKATQRGVTFYKSNGDEIHVTTGISGSYMRMASRWCFLTDDDHVHCTICHKSVVVGTHINYTPLPLPSTLTLNHGDVCCSSTDIRLMPVELRERNTTSYNDTTKLSTRSLTDDWKPLSQRGIPLSNSLLTNSLIASSTEESVVIDDAICIYYQDLIKAVSGYAEHSEEHIANAIRQILRVGGEVSARTVIDILSPIGSEENVNHFPVQGATGGVDYI